MILKKSQILFGIIVFHALDREQIRQIVGLQLERVKRLARGQGLTPEFDDSLVDHFAEVGYQPEFGARELRRQIRSQLETKLAGAMLRGEIGEGDTVKFLHDRAADAVRWEKQAAAERAGRAEEEEERAPRGGERERPRPPAH